MVKRLRSRLFPSRS